VWAWRVFVQVADGVVRVFLPILSGSVGMGLSHGCHTKSAPTRVGWGRRGVGG